MAKIKVGEKALAHLSRGLYRSPASALRELVSNAWDANASRVVIDTNCPTFYQLSVIDDGDGFTRSEFEDLMEGGIGNSDKRTPGYLSKTSRPVIGRLGIGLLGIAQISPAFYISSCPRKGRGFRAVIHLYDLLKDKLDGTGSTQGKLEAVDVGEYDFDEAFDPSVIDIGTRIVTQQVHPTFTNTFKESLQLPKYRTPNRDWQRAIKVFENQALRIASLQEVGDYWRLLWELSTACPLPYFSSDSLPDRLITDDHKRLQSYGFKVLADGIDLKKPVYLKGNKEGYTTSRIGPIEAKVYGVELKFHGYVVVQEARQLKPDELRGVLIRIKNVGIGYYDPSLLDYRINEGPRSRWVTSEIYVEDGLENALNIDRDSFNRFHPEFREIQKLFHQVLQKEIFPHVYRKIDSRSKIRKEKERDRHAEHFNEVITESKQPLVDFGKPDTIDKKQRVEEKEYTPALEEKVSLEDRKSLARVKAPYEDLARAIVALYDEAMNEKDDVARRQRFIDLLSRLLSRW